MKNNILLNDDIKSKIQRIDGTMAQEGMPLTDELKQKLYNCMIGKTTTKIEREKVISKYKKLYRLLYSF